MIAWRGRASGHRPIGFTELPQCARAAVLGILLALLVATSSADEVSSCPTAAPPFDVWALLDEYGAKPGGTQPMLWRFEGQRGAGYLFGTVHLGSPFIPHPPSAALLALSRSDVLVTEVVMDEAAQRTFREWAIAPTPEITPARLGATLYAEYLTDAARRGIRPADARRLRAAAAYLSIGRPRLAHGQALDEQLVRRAQRTGKRVLGLQRIDDLLAALDQFDADDHLTILRDTVCQQGVLPRYWRDLATVYASGLPDAVAAFARAGRERDPLYQAMHQRMVAARNEAFASALLELLESHPRLGVFVTVGAQHLAGPEGLLEMLRSQSFQVERAQR